jgi:two-component system nitrogen regulation response regulator GlnG
VSTILLIEDDQDLVESFKKILKREGHTVMHAGSAEQGLELLAASPTVEMILLDVQLPGMSGLECFTRIQQSHSHVPVIIMTAFGSYSVAIEAIRQGAFDFVTKPFEVPNMLELIRQALGAAGKHDSAREFEADSGEAIIGTSPAMQDVYKAIGRTASTNVTVLIQGESGTGKELVARALHSYSHRADKPFQVINCVAIPESLLESELFGYEKGAFTGADAKRIGSIERASGGTLFFDEIGDMPPSIQAKLLRLLQEKQFQRLGSSQPLAADVRIIAATNRNLEQAILDGQFREDLYYRLNVVRIELPPLRNRKGDIPLLAAHFLKHFAAEMEIENPGITSGAIETLIDYDWPGNVRELSNVVHKALIFRRAGSLEQDDIIKALSQRGQAAGETDFKLRLRQWLRDELAAGTTPDLHATLTENFDRLLVDEALDLAQGNQSRAARLLGISRQNLQNRLKRRDQLAE